MGERCLLLLFSLAVLLGSAFSQIGCPLPEIDSLMDQLIYTGISENDRRRIKRAPQRLLLTFITSAKPLETVSACSGVSQLL